ncbi:T9SS type A sorting domain-containing protein [Flavobacterium caeni]|uniref:Por secretion system C-terminal sorting domain-containing protein n=1 Tax=Flavobacterium caeni TaxID=490189 RepID=A0A1G5B3Y8_9FLAO|nr:T9SS type A sorting domain-containing protein [Flavobacterium caeni]SCX84879.1 Por secretion system C-terminal sorting domain-containing protein [Flavobacterium caeni]
MTHRLSLLWVLFLCGATHAQIIVIPDVNFKTRLLEADVTNDIAKDAENQSIKIDANDNGEIEQSEALAVYRLFYTPPPPLRPAGGGHSQRTTDALPIADIAGLEFFTNLRKLNLSDNALVELELPDLPHLDHLACSHNPMTALMLPELPNLAYLDCSQNELTALAVQNLPALEVLLCDQNQIETLVPAGLTALRTLNCNTNALTSLVFGNNPALKTVSCALNQLTQLDLNQTAVEVLYCSDNPALQSIKIRNNVDSPLTFEQPPVPFPINSFDFSNLPALETVCCDDAEVSVMQTVLESQPLVSIVTDCPLPAFIVFTDPNFKQYLISQDCAHFEGNFYTDGDADLNNDGEIDVDEAKQIITLQISAGNISSLGGLEHFENLWGFGIGANPLTSFGGYGLERLTHLNFTDNQVTTVNLSELAALENFQVVREPITQIDFTGLANLSFARFWEVPVTTLNFCGTGLTYFDGYDLPNLTYFSSRNGIVTTDGLFPQTPPPLSPIILNDCPLLETVCHDEGEYNFINWGVALDGVTYVTDCPEDCSILTTESASWEDVSIYPNPATNVLHIDLWENECSVIVFNGLGQEIKRLDHVGATTIDVSNWARGLYFISVRTATQESTYKIVKQ